MIKRFLVAAGLLAVFSAKAQDSLNLSAKNLKPEERHKVISTTVTSLLSTNAYNKVEVNDDLSRQVFSEYMNAVDFSKSFFLQSDIEEFKKEELKQDDYLQNGDMAFAYKVYNRFLERAENRIKYTFTVIKDSMDFSVKDSFMVRRENAEWPASQEEWDRLWTNKIKYECLSMLATGKDWKSISEVIRKRYETFAGQLKKTKNEDVFDIYMNSFSTIIDPHTNYFSPRDAADFKISSSLSLEGIGATLQTDGEYTKVKEVVKGGPADKSGMVIANDRITAVAQGDTGEYVDVVGWRIDDVVALIRGKKGTVVRLKIIDAKATVTDKPKEVRIVRDKIKLEDQAAKGEIKEIKKGNKTYKAGVIKLPSFYYDFQGAQAGDRNFKSTTRDVKNIIDSLTKVGIDGLIVDLRNNGGGALLEAINLTGLFIKDGPVVEIRNLDGSIDVEQDDDTSIAYRGPLVVLVNRFSASASEIFAGAIQDYNRGIIVGEQTHGKGTVQNVIDLAPYIPLPNNESPGQVKLTIAKFYRVNGSSTQIKGVIPDIALPSLYADKQFGEDESPYALPWDQIRGTDYEKLRDLGEARKSLLKSHEKRVKGNYAYKFLLEDIDTYTAARNRSYVSVEFNAYKKEIEENERRKKEREAEIEKLEKEGKYDKDLILREGLEVIAEGKLEKT
ncbi:MAG TPA: carboxy terminal-processing peptidase [Bacteroidia bacterium]|nr:carboxy terminal-processing peptidase [Bacteroidia bacterium]